MLPRISGQAGSGTEGFPGCLELQEEQAGHLRGQSRVGHANLQARLLTMRRRVRYARVCPALWRCKFFIPFEKFTKKNNITHHGTPVEL